LEIEACSAVKFRPIIGETAGKKVGIKLKKRILPSGAYTTDEAIATHANVKAFRGRTQVMPSLAPTRNTWPSGGLVRFGGWR
jgi:hypothetical protein